MSEAKIIAFTKAIEKAVAEAFSKAWNDHSIWPLSNTKKVASRFGVSTWTVREWAKTGILKSNYQLISGRVIRLVFYQS